MSSPKLRLFFYPQCPFCQFVLRELQQGNIAVEYCHILENPEFREELIQKTGRGTVPCLFIDGEPMHESQDIVSWLKANREQLDKN